LGGIAGKVHGSGEKSLRDPTPKGEGLLAGKAGSNLSEKKTTTARKNATVMPDPVLKSQKKESEGEVA